jgi:hypothetical protein
MPQRRSDAIHPAGVLTHRDLSTILPMLDETVALLMLFNTVAGQMLCIQLMLTHKDLSGGSCMLNFTATALCTSHKASGELLLMLLLTSTMQI